MKLLITESLPEKTQKTGKMFRKISKKLLSAWEFQRQKEIFSRERARRWNPNQSTTKSAMTWQSLELFSATWTQLCASLNTAVWSGGSFVYIPKGVHVELPLQAYFRINAERTGQFERTMIIVEDGASVHYIEGCSAPSYSENSLHAAVVELIALPGSRVRYTTLQNWATNIFNLVTKRA